MRNYKNDLNGDFSAFFKKQKLKSFASFGRINNDD